MEEAKMYGRSPQTCQFPCKGEMNMNEVMNAILTRRSIRKFTADPIPAEVLEDLVKAALHAPSGMGKQTWQFTVVTNQEIIHRLCGLGKATTCTVLPL